MKCFRLESIYSISPKCDECVKKLYNFFNYFENEA